VAAAVGAPAGLRPNCSHDAPPPSPAHRPEMRRRAVRMLGGECTRNSAGGGGTATASLSLPVELVRPRYRLRHRRVLHGRRCRLRSP
jgi:hypothetical protein